MVLYALYCSSHELPQGSQPSHKHDVMAVGKRSSRIAIAVLLIVVIISISRFTLKSPFLPTLVEDESQDSSNSKIKKKIPLLPANYDPSLKATLFPPCQMLIFNRPDWHYEILESVAIRYPIPWERFECSTAEPVLVDYMVSGTDHKLGWAEGNDNVEHSGFIRYFNQYLNHTVRPRADGLSVQFRSIQSGSSDSSKYHVIIDASNCGGLLEDDRRFCVGHIQCNMTKDCMENPVIRKKRCGLNPMHKEDCFFLARDLPQFPKQDDDNNNNNTIIIGCTSGPQKDFERLGQAINALDQKPTDLEIRYFNRFFEVPGSSVRFNRIFERHGIQDMMKLVAELDFIKFQKLFSQCDFFMPLLTPRMAAGYFPGRGSKMSGGISQTIAYQIPTLLHQELYDVYAPHLAKPSMGYNGTEQFTKVLSRMLTYLRNNKRRGDD